MSHVDDLPSVFAAGSAEARIADMFSVLDQSREWVARLPDDHLNAVVAASVSEMVLRRGPEETAVIISTLLERVADTLEGRR